MKILLNLFVLCLLSSCTVKITSNFQEGIALRRIINNKVDLKKLEYSQTELFSGYFPIKDSTANQFYYVPHGQHIIHRLGENKIYIVFKIDLELKKVFAILISIRNHEKNKFFLTDSEILNILEMGFNDIKKSGEPCLNFVTNHTYLNIKSVPLYIKDFSKWNLLHKWPDNSNTLESFTLYKNWKKNILIKKKPWTYSTFILNGEEYIVSPDNRLIKK